MLQFKPPSSIYAMKGNQPLLLQSEKTAWYVHSGSVSLFTTTLNDAGEVITKRQYWFTVSAGEWILDTGLSYETAKQNYGMIAIANEASELEAHALSDFMTAVAKGQPEAVQGLQTWLRYLSNWRSEQRLDLAGESNDSLFLKKSRYVSLRDQQTLFPHRDTVQWVRVQEGKLQWLGWENFTLDETVSLFPLTVDLWLKAEGATEVEIVPWENLPSEGAVWEGLKQLHSYLFSYLDCLNQEATEIEFRRFQQRQKLKEQTTSSAMQELSAVLMPQTVPVAAEGTPLLIAAGAVGRALGIHVSPPTDSEDLYRVANPLDAIARASRFRTRRVLLLGKWWEQDQGSLLAYTKDGQPCALLKESGKPYALFDPITLTRTPVDQSVAETLSMQAYMFYRPLPEQINRADEIFRFAVRGYLGDIVWLIGLGVIGSLLGMVIPQATAVLVNDAIPSSDRALLWQLGLALVIAAFARAVFAFAQGLVSLRLENVTDGTLQPAAWDRLLQLHPTFFRQFASGELLVRLLSINQIRKKLSGATQTSLLNGVFALLNLGLMFFYSVKLAVVGAMIAVLTTILTVITSRKLVQKARQQEVMDGQINSLNVELIGGVAKLRVAAAEERALGAWAKLFAERTRLNSAIQRLNDSITVLTEVLPLLSSVLIFWFAILFLQNSDGQANVGLTLGGFLAFNAAYSTFFGGVTSLGTTVTDVLEIIPLWERAEVIVRGKPEVDSTKTDPGRLTGRLKLDQITFRYRDDGPLILDDVSIEAEPGEFIALVGPSGSGKSTVFRMLLGFETPYSGTVYYDGQDLAGLNIQAVRRQLGVVLQNGKIGAGSIFENITGGAMVSLDEAWDAAYSAGFADDIEQMPMGMHTVVSEGGTNLSGGQRQRLLIARAIVLKPNIMLLDEATSALDNRTQAIVTESLDRLQATRIVVAHRLSTIRNADRIYVLKSGSVVQSGTFEELVAQDGLFATLAARQLD